MSICGAALFGLLWGNIIEMVRFGNGHMSFTFGRLPWGHYRVALFVVGVLGFWLTAGLHHQLASWKRHSL